MFEKIMAFFEEVKLETKKVAFPGKDELVGSTWVVIIFVFIISFFLSIVDMGLSKLVGVIIK